MIRTRTETFPADPGDAHQTSARQVLLHEKQGFFTYLRSSISRRDYDEFVVQLELTLALALTETLMLADALTEASAAVPAHAIALPPKFADALTTAFPVAATFSRARATSGPFVLAVRRIAGKLVSSVAFSLARSLAAATSTLATRVTVSGSQINFAEACAPQLD
jgi:hypothetical protein